MNVIVLHNEACKLHDNILTADTMTFTNLIGVVAKIEIPRK